MTDKKSDPEVIEYGPTKKRSWLVVSLAGLLILTWLAMAGGGYYFYKKGMNLPANSPSKDEMISELKQELKAQQEEIYKQIGTVQKSIDQVPKGSGAMQPPSLQFDDAEIRKSLSELGDKLRSIERKVENPESKIDNTLTPLMLSAINLRQRINEGSSFQLELQVLKDMSRRDKALAEKVDELAAILEKGEVRRVQDLQAEFPSIADSAIVNFEKGGEDKEKTTLEKFKGMVGKWVVIRKVDGDLTGNDPEIVIARIQRAVKTGNLRRALEEYKKLETEKAIVPTLDAWASEAQRILDVEERLAELNSYIVRRSGTLPSPFSSSPLMFDEGGVPESGGDDPEEDVVPEEKPTDAI